MSAINAFLARRTFDTRATLKILLVLVGLAILATLVSRGVFIQPANLLNMSSQNAILIVIALAQLLVIITGGIDLSVGAVVAVSSVLVVLLQDLGLGVAIAIAMLVAMGFGLVNGFLVTYVRLPAFVVTLATMQIGYSLSRILSGGGAVYTGWQGAPLPAGLVGLFQSSLLGIPYPLIISILFLAGIALYLRTSMGHFAYTLGGNERAAVISGIPTRRVKMLIYVLASLLCCAGGILFVSRVGMGDPQAGAWLPLDSIAAVSIGGASLSGGIGTVPGTLIGVMILSVLNNIMNLLGVPPTLQPAIKGLVILVTIYLNSARKQN